jgi:hypothetical protein
MFNCFKKNGVILFLSKKMLWGTYSFEEQQTELKKIENKYDFVICGHIMSQNY